MRPIAIEPEELQVLYDLACALAQLDEPGLALDQLEKYAGLMPPPRINWLKHDADLDPLRKHPRYKTLVEKAEARLAAFQAEHIRGG